MTSCTRPSASEEARRRLGLLINDDEECEHAVEEAVTRQMPRQLHGACAVFLAYIACSQPALLREKFKAVMMEDFVRRREMWPWRGGGWGIEGH